MRKWRDFRSHNLNLVDKWLIENDPYYKNPKSNKIKNFEYPYLTPKQEDYRSSREICFSNVYDYKDLIEQNVDLKPFLDLMNFEEF